MFNHCRRAGEEAQDRSHFYNTSRPMYSMLVAEQHFAHVTNQPVCPAQEKKGEEMGGCLENWKGDQ